MSGRVLVKIGDITKENVEAIVNAANSSLLGGSGVDGAIHSAGGPELREECEIIRAGRFPNGLPTGEAVVTTAGAMQARYVIHTVGPIYGRNRGRDAEFLAACYTNSLRLAVENNVSTIAFPAISTGVYGYPKDKAAKVASGAIVEFLEGDEHLSQVRLVFHNQLDADEFLRSQSFGI